MREAFGGREVDKRYWALVTGPLADEGDRLPLRHQRHPDRVEPALEGESAREAHSEFRVLERAGEYSLVEVRISTGVLHQVRAHLAAVGAPLVGDTLYGGREEPGLGRFFLHARALGLTHPVTKQRVRVESPLPESSGRCSSATPSARGPYAHHLDATRLRPVHRIHEVGVRGVQYSEADAGHHPRGHGRLLCVGGAAGQPGAARQALDCRRGRTARGGGGRVLRSAQVRRAQRDAHGAGAEAGAARWW